MTYTVTHEISHHKWFAAEDEAIIGWLVEGVAMMTATAAAAPYLCEIFPEVSKPSFADCMERGDYGSYANHAFYYTSYFFTKALYRMLGKKLFARFIWKIWAAEGDALTRIRQACQDVMLPADSLEELEKVIWVRLSMMNDMVHILAMAKRHGIHHQQCGQFSPSSLYAITDQNGATLLGYREDKDAAPIVLGHLSRHEVFALRRFVTCIEEHSELRGIIHRTHDENEEIDPKLYRAVAKVLVPISRKRKRRLVEA